jgi:8-oxo-dGTP diphosphatase
MKKLFPLVTTDIALLTVKDERLHVLLVRRANEPEKGCWALPGGVLDPAADRSLDDTVRRVLRSKTHVDIRYMEQVEVFSGRDRDPRGWSISVVYYALLPSDKVSAVAGDKAEAIEWVDAVELNRRLAFDHPLLLEAAVGRLRDKVAREALPLHLLPEKFTLTELQRTCEAVLGRPLDKSVFRRRIKDEPALVEMEGEFLRGPQRPAQLYATAEDFQFDGRGP